MIELSLQNPAFAPVIRTALIGQPDAMLLVEFAGSDKPALVRQLRPAGRADGGSRPARTRWSAWIDDAPQKNLWEVRKAGLNIMMSLKGDGKPVSFIEDCAVPLEHLAEYTDALTQVFRKHGSKGTWYAHASVGTLHVRPILDMRREGAAKMRAIARRSLGPGAQVQGRLQRRAWRRPVPRRMDRAGSSAPGSTKRLPQIKLLFDPAQSAEPAAHGRSAKDG